MSRGDKADVEQQERLRIVIALRAYVNALCGTGKFERDFVVGMLKAASMVEANRFEGTIHPSGWWLSSDGLHK